MADRVDPSMHAVQARERDPVLDSAVREPDGAQLARGHEAELAAGEVGERPRVGGCGVFLRR
ncbi:MAG TPA: hypothetical protein VL977_08345, partial [Solirubrobacteraceae bacterium]|nr:hypothetical protein [Solirubrobacteraceae bacterium]